MPIFIGIDLAWQSDKNHSGGAVLRGDQKGVEVLELSQNLSTLSEIEKFICLHALDDSVVVAIDAPLIIKNNHGQRPCETEIGRRFASAHASAHSTNLTRYPNAGSLRLVRILEDHGFQHCPQAHERHLAGKWFFEVYPHPAQVVLFERNRIIKYKKGLIASRRSGLVEFREYLRGLRESDPPLITNQKLQSFLEVSVDDLRGTSLKQYEDKLDATFCAYLAAYFWAWSYERNEMIGDHDTGYIINPRPTNKH